MKKSNKNASKRITVCAMLSALGVVMLAVGALFQSLDLTTAALASVLCIYAVIEIGGSAPWLIWGATAFLGVLLLPQKSPAVFYIFLGCYPMIKEKLEKLRRLPCNLLKGGTFALLLLAVWLVLRIFFPADAEFTSGWLLGGFLLLGYVTFWVYDNALTRLITLYLTRLRSRFGLKWK